jgi:hypothetical protein
MYNLETNKLLKINIKLLSEVKFMTLLFVCFNNSNVFCNSVLVLSLETINGLLFFYRV